MAVITPDIIQSDPKARRRNYSPHHCHADGCQEEAHWRGYCLKHYTQLRKDHPMTEQTAPVAEEKKPQNESPKKPAKTPIPLERFREVVEQSGSLSEAARTLGITSSGVADRCKRSGIPTPAQRMGKAPVKKSTPKKKAQEKVEPVKVELAPPPERPKKANQIADLNAEAVALGIIAQALQELTHESRIHVISRLQSLVAY